MRKKNESKHTANRDIQYKESGQEYAQAIKMLGNGRLTVQCFDGIKRLAHIRGKLRNAERIATGDILLVGLRDYQDEKCDVILRYTPDETRTLKSNGLITIETLEKENVKEVEETGFTFDDI